MAGDSVRPTWGLGGGEGPLAPPGGWSHAAWLRRKAFACGENWCLLRAATMGLPWCQAWLATVSPAGWLVCPGWAFMSLAQSPGSWPGKAELPEPFFQAGRAGLSWAGCLGLWTRWRLGWAEAAGTKRDCVGWALRACPGLVLQPLRGQCPQPAAGSPPAELLQRKALVPPAGFLPACSFGPWRLGLGFLPVCRGGR